MSVKTNVISEDGKIHFHRVQDVEPVLRQAETLRKHGHVGSSEMRHAARFPMVIVEAYLNDNNIELSEFLKNPEHAKRMLSDPALSAFRVWEGNA